MFFTACHSLKSNKLPLGGETKVVTTSQILKGGNQKTGGGVMETGSITKRNIITKPFNLLFRERNVSPQSTRSSLLIFVSINALIELFTCVQQTGWQVFSPWLPKEEHVAFFSSWRVQPWVSINTITCNSSRCMATGMSCQPHGFAAGKCIERQTQNKTAASI